MPIEESKTPLRHIINYSIGEGVNSLTMNGIANFAMLYYTKVLGLDAQYAGLALGSAIIWDAITDPIMGHITDNTRSRYGRHHPYILIGGILTSLSFFFLWFVPEVFHEPKILFWYLLGLNLLIRTTVTVYGVPYTALGFLISTDYKERSTLQGVRNFWNQIVNFAGGAMAWSLFFRDIPQPNGTVLDGTNVAVHYYRMGIALTLASIAMVIYCVFSTQRYAIDSRRQESHNDLKSFARDFWQILCDRNALIVFSCLGIISLGTMLVAQVQMFTYVDFMKFTHLHKTIVHGAGMIAFALGALLQAWLVKHWDKKQTAFVGFGFCIFGNVMLMLLFIGGLLPPQTVWKLPEGLPLVGSMGVPVSVLAFAVFQGMWWGGCGIVGPLSVSMIADISEINKLRTGILKDGSYSAVFSFLLKTAMGAGMFLNGWLLTRAGFISGIQNQSPEVVRNVAILTFVSGPIVILLAVPIMAKYPINRVVMQKIKKELV